MQRQNFQIPHFKKLVSSGNITKKEIKDPYYPSVERVGYLGVGTYKPTGKVYKTWHNMIIRCYSNDYHQREPSYKECSVCEEWLNFQNFAKWWHINYLEEGDLDKDLLVMVIMQLYKNMGNQLIWECLQPNKKLSMFINQQKKLI